MRIFQYYLPVFFWCWGRVKEHKAGGNKAPLVVGIQAVQGCGKTTLVEELRSLFTRIGLKAASVSIDDFYLPFQKQQELIKVGPFFLYVLVVGSGDVGIVEGDSHDTCAVHLVVGSHTCRHAHADCWGGRNCGFIIRQWSPLPPFPIRKPCMHFEL